MNRAKLEKICQRIADATRGVWVKDSLGDYVTDAYDYYHYALNPDDLGYKITITKENNKWWVFAEDHEIEDLQVLGVDADTVGYDLDGNSIVYPENGFTHLYKAKIWVEAFGEWFQEINT